MEGAVFDFSGIPHEVEGTKSKVQSRICTVIFRKADQIGTNFENTNGWPKEFLQNGGDQL